MPLPTWIDMPELSRSILWGLREELEQKGVQVGLMIGSPSWHECYRHGIMVLEAGPHHHLLCNIYLYKGILTLLKSGGVRAGDRAGGDQKDFDLNDPQSIPGIVAAVQWLRFGLPEAGK